MSVLFSLACFGSDVRLHIFLNNCYQSILFFYTWTVVFMNSFSIFIIFLVDVSVTLLGGLRRTSGWYFP